ncbi:MAG: thiamine diphosphokinase [Anaerolineae bacterium]|nr:thiamine diphosphokinase [Anaerolineae bacterium]
MKQALIFANGDRGDGEMVQRALHAARDPLIIAADGGARIAHSFGLQPHVVIGDMDSLTSAEIVALRDQSAQIHAYPPEKNETDLELAFQYAARIGVDWIRVIGALGDRFDQTIANMYLMALPDLHGRDVACVAGRQQIFLIAAGQHTLHGEIGDTLSLIPLGGAVDGIQTDGLYYPLRDETLAFGPARGVSNLFAASQAHLQIRSGNLLVIHTLGRA